MENPPVKPGEILDGKYRIERVLGAGGMGIVVAAVHVVLGQRVALKFIQLRGERDAVEEERFIREARIAVMLKSNHVARVFDVGQLESGSPYLVMELLEGQDFQGVLKARGPLPVGEAVDYLVQMCEAITEAHAAGIVHRDLKPANLFLTRCVDGAPCVKVLDFGISKLSGSDLDLTRTGEAVGSPLYMAPEQLRANSDVDARADIWSLGAIAYELLVGRTPFHARTMLALCQRLLDDDPTPIEHSRADVPPPLGAAILRCVEKNREQRWADVAAFRTALLPYASASLLSSHQNLSSPSPTVLMATGPALVTSAGARLRGGGVLAWGALALGVVAAAILILMRLSAIGTQAPGVPIVASVSIVRDEVPSPVTSTPPPILPPAPAERVVVVPAEASAPSSSASSAASAPTKSRWVRPAVSVDYNRR